MVCPVCNGSGISPGSMRIGGLACGACGGSGVRADPEPEFEPVEEDVSGTGALESSFAFGRHLESLFGGREAEEHEDYTQLSGVKLDMAAMRIDRRYMAQLPDLMLGRTTPETVTRLESIVEDYRRLLPEADRGLILDRGAIDRKVADATKSLAAAHENLGDTDAAWKAYDRAHLRYLALGAADEAADCEANVSRIKSRGDVDAKLAVLHDRLDAATQPLDLADVRIELAELHMSRGDDFEAEQHLREAERLLEPYRSQAGGAATADALARTLAQIMDPGSAGGAPGVGIEDTMRVRGLLSRLYRGLARVAPDQAAAYQDRLLQLEASVEQGSRDNAEFSERMRALLDDLNRRQGLQ